MPRPPLQLLVDPPLPGAWNMAVDEALLDDAIKRGAATLRFYQWEEPTLSLGYFQRYGERAGHEASLGCPCVRRHSGGGAILHDRELTYSLALPGNMLPAAGAEALYRLAHESLVELLGERRPAWRSRLRLSEGIRRPPADEPFLCFQRRSAGDVVIDDKPGGGPGGDWKVVGSAQRKRRGAVLQHGSLLLERSPAAPELPGLLEIAGGAPAFEEIVADWPELLASGLGRGLAESKLSSQTRSAAERIAAERFKADAWTRRR